MPLGAPALTVLGALPILLILSAVGLEIQSREIGLPGVLVAGSLAAVGPMAYGALVKRRLPAKSGVPA